jgi:ABC-type antimicrobial peptide transport system permease subunit
MRIFSKPTGLGIVLSVALTFSVTAADTQKAKTGRVSGNVRTINKDTAEVTLRRGTADRIVIVGGNTKFNRQSSGAKTTPSSIDEVNPSNYMTCTGTWDGAKLAASQCTISSPRGR